jgi:hypothetical protein
MMKPDKIEPVMYTKESLQAEQRRLKAIIRGQETALRQRVKSLPGEMFYAGANAIVPTMLSGKISHSVLNAGRSLINKVVDNTSKDNDSKLVAMAKQAGLFTLLKIGFNAFMKRKV